MNWYIVPMLACLLFALPGCTSGPGHVSTSSTGAPLSTRPLYDAAFNATDDPVSRITEDIHAKPTPNGWTHAFLLKALAIVRSDQSYGISNNAVTPGMQAVFFALLGDESAIRQLQSNFDAEKGTIGSIDDALDLECAKDPNEFTNHCSFQAKQQVEYATFLLLLGDRAESERRYLAIEQNHDAIMRTFFADYDLGSVEYQLWFDANFQYLLEAGELEKAAQAMRDYIAFISDPAYNSIDSTPGAAVLDAWSRAGHSRQLAQLTRLITSDRSLDGVILTTYLYRDFDAALLRDEPVDSLLARLQVLADLRHRYSDAQVGWHNQMISSLECRLGLITALKGDQAGALDLYSAALSPFSQAQYDYGWELGLCLYRLAPQVGRSDDQPRILEIMRRHTEDSKDTINKNTDELIEEYRDSTYVNIAENSIAHANSFRDIQLLVGARPQAYLFLDPDRFRQAAASALQKTIDVRKDDPTLGSRGDELMVVVNFVLDRFLYVGE